MFWLITKLTRVKVEVQNWEKIKNVESQKALVEIEAEIQILSGVVDHLHFSIDRKERLLRLEAKCGKFLKQKEETLRKKSRAIWL